MLESQVVTNAAGELVEALGCLVEQWELATGTRTNKRGATRARFIEALGAFAGDLFGALGTKRANGWTYRSLQAGSFSGEQVSYRTFTGVLEALCGLGFVHHVAGRKHWTANHFNPAGEPYASGGIASHFRALPPLVELGASFGDHGGQLR